MATDGLPRLRITKLHIENFRCIDSLDLDLTDGNGEPIDLAVFAGDNGCGKTTVLEAILLLFGKGVDFPEGASKANIRFGADKYQLSGERIHIQKNKISTAKSIYQMNLDGALGRGGEFGYLEIEHFSAHRNLNDSVMHRLNELKRRLINTYYRSLRSAKRRPMADLSTPFARLQKLWERFNGEGQTIDVIPISNDPGSGDEVVLRDKQLPVPEEVTSLEMARRLATSRPDIPRMVPLDRLSSGQMALFAFAGPLIFRDKPADIVLIDEPEQHMHVQWQRLILPALRELSPSTQFLVATHSLEILDSALSYERFILVGEKDPRAHLEEESNKVRSSEDVARLGSKKSARADAVCAVRAFP